MIARVTGSILSIAPQSGHITSNISSLIPMAITSNPHSKAVAAKPFVADWICSSRLLPGINRVYTRILMEDGFGGYSHL